ncbi:MAG: alpha/beta-type small acid-soluble spore protein [Clostridia bacterium]|nr:alpha/beta-type small acid-soluble spore protein [Clostridia bacterium]
MAIDPNARKALNELKYEIAKELDLTKNILINESGIDSGQDSFFAGYVGGGMTKKLVEMGERALVNRYD